WGSDLLWGGRTETFRPALRSVLAHCDYYRATCHRDVALARAFGFRGRALGCWPSPGGLDLGHVRRFAVGPPSSRRAIVVKGQLSANSRGDVALDAVERCADVLGGWELVGHTMHPDVAARAES